MIGAARRERRCKRIIAGLVAAREHAARGAFAYDAVRAALPGWRNFFRRERVITVIERAAGRHIDETIADWDTEITRAETLALFDKAIEAAGVGR